MSEDNVECFHCVVRDDALAPFERLLQLIETDLREPPDLHFEHAVAAFAGKRDLKLHLVASDRQRVFAVEVVATVKHWLLTGEDFLTVGVHHCVDNLAIRKLRRQKLKLKQSPMTKLRIIEIVKLHTG